MVGTEGLGLARDMADMRKPNLLFIFTDEQRADTLGAYGNDRIHMPNLDRLASESFVFGSAYATQPVCTPSRSSIMTGLFPHSNGCTENNVPLPADIPCFPEMLSDPGYAAGYYGKWHLGDEIFAQHGFEDWISVEDYYSEYYGDGRDRQARSSYHHFLISQGLEPLGGDKFSREEVVRFREELSKPSFVAREAVRFIRENRNRPFVLFVNFLEPHMPFASCRDNQYDPGEVTLPGNFSELTHEAQPLKTRVFREAYFETGHGGIALKTEENWRRLIANYWGLCSLVDTHTGTILNALAENDLYDNTIIVFTSDHGDMMGSHGLLAKCVMFEEAVRVPLLIHLPGQRKAERIGFPVSQIDLVPTLLDLMEQTVPSHLQGESLKPLMAQSHTRDRPEAFVEWNGANTGFGDELGKVHLPEPVSGRYDAGELEEAVTDPVRTIVNYEGWKLNCSPRGEHELYNLLSDPLETDNLARDGSMIGVARRLRERLRAWQDKTGDRVELPEI